MSVYLSTLLSYGISPSAIMVKFSVSIILAVAVFATAKPIQERATCDASILATFDDLPTAGPRAAAKPIGTYNALKYQDMCKTSPAIQTRYMVKLTGVSKTMRILTIAVERYNMASFRYLVVMLLCIGARILFLSSNQIILVPRSAPLTSKPSGLAVHSVSKVLLLASHVVL